MTTYRYECPTCGNVDIRQEVASVQVTAEIIVDIEALRAAHGLCPICGLPAGWFSGRDQ